jgi:Uncharacterised nucleotidyltransferase
MHMNNFRMASVQQAPRAGTGDRLRSVDKALELSLWSLHVDKVAASVTRELLLRGIDSILLKGPAVARWLYRDGTPRPYGDADIMVAPSNWQATRDMLRELGFRKELGPLAHPGMDSIASEAWVRENQNVDLHCTLWGVGVAPEAVWRALQRSDRTIELDGTHVRTLAPEAQALLLATHAASHGDGWAVTDLERGVRMLPLDLWRRAGALAVELAAIPAFAAGMRLVEGGRELMLKLGLPDAPLAEASLRAWRVPMSMGFEQLARTSGASAKAGVVIRELLPTPAFMRWWTPLARRGRPGLAAAYVWRVVWAVRHAVPAYLAWRRARRVGESPTC